MTRSSADSETPELRSTLTRIVRVLTLGIGAAGLLFLALLLPSIIAQWPMYAMWWNLLATGSLFACSVGLVVASIVHRPLTLRRLHVVGACILLTVTAMAPIASVRPVPDGQVPWILDVIAVPTTMAAVGLRPVLAWGVTALAAVLAGIVRTTTGAEGSALIGLENGVQTATFCAVFVLLVVAVLQAGGLSDRTLATARTETALAVSARARADVRKRIDALVHDRVLATLLLAGRARSPEERALASTHAADALDELARQGDPDTQVVHATPREFVWDVQGLVRDLDPDAQFSYEIDREPPVPSWPDGSRDDVDPASTTTTDRPAVLPHGIPDDVAEAVTAATLEALRNSLRHAGGRGVEPARAVHVVAGRDRLEVTVLDDGVGFDVSRVASTRLGIESSIRARMRAVGGTSQIVSHLGQGTRVVIGWTRPLDDGAATVAGGERAPVSSGATRVPRALTPFDLDFWTMAPRIKVRPRAERGRRYSEIAAGVLGTETLGRGGSVHGGPLLVFAGLQIVTVVVLSVGSDPRTAMSWSNLLAVGLYAVTVTVLALPGPMPIQLETGFAVVFSCLAISMLVFLTLPAGVDPGYQAWHFGANSVMLLVLGLRGRILLSWVAMACMAALTVWWCFSSGFGLEEAVGFLNRNVATLAVGSGVSFQMRRAITRTLAIREALDRQYSIETAELAAAEEQSRVLKRFESAALPALIAIASGAPPTAGEQRDWLATEAMLRDRIRARSLDLEPLRSAVHAARERGMRVVLLDDTDGREIPPCDRVAALEWAADVVRGVQGPEITVRLRSSPQGELSLTIAGDDVTAERRLGTDDDEADEDEADADDAQREDGGERSPLGTEGR